jgi:sugar/nucleoside kinase (ribokinase family)
MGLYLKTSANERLVRMGRARPSRIESWAKRELWSPCFKAKVIGTTGAGDATIAGFIAALLRDQNPEECMTMACAVGACNVEATDALSGLLSWEQTQARVQAGWPRWDLPLMQAGWKKDAATGVWRSSADSATGSGS